MGAVKHPVSTLARLVHENFLWLLLGSYALAAVAPGPGLALAQATPANLSVLGERSPLTVPMLLLAGLLWRAGLEVRLGALRHLLARPGVLLAGLAANLAVPVAFILASAQVLRFWHDPEGMQNVLLGLGLVAAMPIAGSATAWSQKAEGNLSLSLALVLCSTFLSLWTTPLTLQAVSVALADEQAAALQVLAEGGAGAFLFLCVLVPTTLGILSRGLLGEQRLARARAALKVLGCADLLLLVYANTAAALPAALARSGPDLLAAMFGVAASFCVVCFAAGWLVARLLRASRAEETSLLFALGMSNNGTGLVLASVALAGRPQATLMIVGYNLVQHLVAGTVDFLRARQPEPAPSLSRLAWALRPVVTFGSVLVAGVALASACTLYWNVRTLADTNSWVVHTHQVLVRLHQTLSLLKDAETGQRGYLLTGREHYLEPYRDAVAGLPERRADLKALTADNPEQQARFPELERRVRAKLAELRRAIAARREEGHNAALAVVLEDSGKREMDAIRRLVARMEATERAALERRTAEADRRGRRAVGSVLVVGALFLTLPLLRGLAGPAGPGAKPFRPLDSF
jgi:BASS family bile acid:Na+ symporter